MTFLRSLNLNDCKFYTENVLFYNDIGQKTTLPSKKNCSILIRFTQKWLLVYRYPRTVGIMKRQIKDIDVTYKIFYNL